MDLLAQPTLRANAEAVADDEHSDHQLRINRGPPHVAIIGPQMRPNLGQVDETVDLAQQMIVGDMPLKAKAVEERLLHHPPLAIIGRISCIQQKRISATRPDQAEFFNIG